MPTCMQIAACLISHMIVPKEPVQDNSADYLKTPMGSLSDTWPLLVTTKWYRPPGNRGNLDESNHSGPNKLEEPKTAENVWAMMRDKKRSKDKKQDKNLRVEKYVIVSNAESKQWFFVQLLAWSQFIDMFSHDVWLARVYCLVLAKKNSEAPHPKFMFVKFYVNQFVK